MLREDKFEILEETYVADDLVARAYSDLSKIHRWLGDTASIVHAIRRDPLPVRRLLDVGCGLGLVAGEIRRRLGIETVGIDIRTYPSIAAGVTIVEADARSDALPFADIAYSLHLGHHLSESDLESMIRNVGRFCRRFILLDLVRHPLPLALFRLCVAPWVSPISAEDGRRSVRRAYTQAELRAVAASALEGSDAVFQSTVAPFYIRQILDISYDPAGRRARRDRPTEPLLARI